MALYSTYRPRDFSQVVGQDATVDALRNALDSGKIAHALLLSGPHGVGKTTLARLVAGGLGCHKGPTSKPCGKCPGCLAFGDSSNPDLVEIDAASNRGVDDARALRERLYVAPMSGRCHVIIIDEAHMLTREAQNALLKVLEEPPGEAYFIFATTAPHKVLPTIRSRCQHFSLRRPSGAQLAEAVGHVAEQEGVECLPGAIEAICGAAAGSYRDALSLLEQVISASPTGSVSPEIVAEISGLPGLERWQQMLDAVASGDGGAALGILDDLRQSGYDLAEALRELAGLLRLVLYAQQTGGVPESLVDDPRAEAAAVDLAGKLTPAQLFALLGTIEDCYAQVSAGGQADIVLEAGVARCAGGDVAQAGRPAAPKAVSTPAPAAKTEPAKAADSETVAAPTPAAEPAPVTAPEAKPEPAPQPKAEKAPVAEPPPVPKAQKPTPGADGNPPLPGPAVAAAAWPLLRLALREQHTDVYLALRTGWARYEEGRMVIQLAEPLSKSDEREAIGVLRRMVNGSVKLTSRPKAKAPKTPRTKKSEASAPPMDPAELLSDFGMVPLDGE